MIRTLKEYFQTLLSSITGMESSRIYLDAREESFYRIPPWGSVLTQSSSLNYSEMARDFENGRILKYSVPLLLKIALCGTDEETVSAWEQDFLEQIPVQFEHNEVRVEVRVKNAERSDNSSQIRGLSIVSFEVECLFGIYIDEEAFQSQYQVLP